MNIWLSAELAFVSLLELIGITFRDFVGESSKNVKEFQLLAEHYFVSMFGFSVFDSDSDWMVYSKIIFFDWNGLGNFFFILLIFIIIWINTLIWTNGYPLALHGTITFMIMAMRYSCSMEAEHSIRGLWNKCELLYFLKNNFSKVFTNLNNFSPIMVMKVV